MVCEGLRVVVTAAWRGSHPVVDVHGVWRLANGSPGSASKERERLDRHVLDALSRAICFAGPRDRRPLGWKTWCPALSNVDSPEWLRRSHMPEVPGVQQAASVGSPML